MFAQLPVAVGGRVVDREPRDGPSPTRRVQRQFRDLDASEAAEARQVDPHCSGEADPGHTEPSATGEAHLRLQMIFEAATDI